MLARKFLMISGIETFTFFALLWRKLEIDATLLWY
jgi:hypothetical protein